MTLAVPAIPRAWAQDAAKPPDQAHAPLAATDATSPPAIGEVPLEAAAPREVIIESIAVRGNKITDVRVVTRALSLQVGSRFVPTVEVLQLTRANLLSLGYFRAVDISLGKGSIPGAVTLIIVVTERVPWTLDRLWFGTSNSSKAWLGAALSHRNVGGSGWILGGAAIGAWAGNAEGARSQAGTRLYLARPGRVSFHAAGLAVRGSEPLRINGADGEDAAANFRGYDFSRFGTEAGATIRVRPRTEVQAAVRYDYVIAADPLLSSGRQAWLGGNISLRYDDRDNPFTPLDGNFGALRIGVAKAGDTEYGTVDVRWDNWQPVPRGALGLRFVATTTLGATPWFDAVFLGDVNRMVAPRALGLPLSAQSAPRFFRSAAAPRASGNLGGSAMIEYVLPMRWQRGHIVSAQAFFGAGVYSLGDRADWGDDPVGRPMQTDALLDAGVRLETTIGVFELSIANAWGRLPW